MMSPDDLKEELQELFRNGATVASLLAHARDGIDCDAPKSQYMGAVLSAFHLNPGGWNILWGTDSFGNGEQRDQVLTELYLGEVIRRASTWDDSSDGEPRWYDGVAISSWKELHEKAENGHGISQAGWAALGEEDRQKIRNASLNAVRSGELVSAIAALAERLQQRVNELKLLEHQPA